LLQADFEFGINLKKKTKRELRSDCKNGTLVVLCYYIKFLALIAQTNGVSSSIEHRMFFLLCFQVPLY
jgi:hypothetical protein